MSHPGPVFEGRKVGVVSRVIPEHIGEHCLSDVMLPGSKWV